MTFTILALAASVIFITLFSLMPERIAGGAAVIIAITLGACISGLAFWYGYPITGILSGAFAFGTLGFLIALALFPTKREVLWTVAAIVAVGLPVCWGMFTFFNVMLTERQLVLLDYRHTMTGSTLHWVAAIIVFIFAAGGVFLFGSWVRTQMNGGWTFFKREEQYGALLPRNWSSMSTEEQEEWIAPYRAEWFAEEHADKLPEFWGELSDAERAHWVSNNGDKTLFTKPKETSSGAEKLALAFCWLFGAGGLLSAAVVLSVLGTGLFVGGVAVHKTFSVGHEVYVDVTENPKNPVNRLFAPMFAEGVYPEEDIEVMKQAPVIIYNDVNEARKPYIRVE